MSPVTTEQIRIGALGAGGFGRFALEHFSRVPGVTVAAVADLDGAAATDVADRLGAAVEAPDRLVERDDIDLVYISTPPYLHHPQSMAALGAGKHVVCEKPLALTLSQADEMIGFARDRGLVMTADLMQRYNPLYQAVARLVSSGLLGEPLHGFLENYATDEHLTPDHWFWEPNKSGGIFIEHGVHFFDMFDGWFGEGTVVAAQEVTRPAAEIVEQAGCTVRHPAGVLVNHYHGFTQPEVMDRQELRIVFELGDVSLYGWIPLTARVRAVLGAGDVDRLSEFFPGGIIDRTESFGSRGLDVTGRHKTRRVDVLIDLCWQAGVPKQRRYGDMVAALLADQVRWIHDRSHRRLVTESNGKASLAAAVAATRLAGRRPTTGSSVR